MNKFFAADPAYKQMTETYDKKDAWLALGVYLCVLLFYLGAGHLQMTTGSNIAAMLANLLLAVIVLLIVRFRKQPISTVGLTLHKVKRSLPLGAILGILLSVGLNIMPTILVGGQWRGFGSMVWNFFYMLINIAFVEELVFRGFIQTRLYGIIKSEAVAIFVGGLMFMGMHIPFQLFNRSNGNIIEFFANNSVWLLTTLIMHVLFNFLYRKYNSLVAPTVCHFIMNFGSTLFG